MSVLIARNVHAGYRGRAVLVGVDLDFEPGLHLLLGPNGAGKTTLFRTLCGILTPTLGEVRVNGRDPHREIEAKALVGISAHRAALVPRLTVRDNLRFWARVMPLTSREREQRVEEVLATVEMTEMVEQRAGTLSRGQSQRVGLAKALLTDPPVLLLDEPTSGVDPALASRLRGQLRALADEGRTVLMSTHELADASELADDVTVLHRGRIAGQGAPEALRQELLGHGYRVRLRGRGDLRGTLETLGYEVETSRHDGLIVEVDNEDAVEKLVAELVRAGIGVHEVMPADNALEDVYTRLQERGAANA